MNRYYSAILLVLGCLMFIPSSYAEESTAQTRLRTSTPKGTFKTYSGATRLTNIEVRVRNVGSVDAENVIVEATAPDGTTQKLYGPSTLSANKDAVYSNSMHIYVTNTKRIKASADCSNCYN